MTPRLSDFLSLNLISNFLVGWQSWDQNEGREANMLRQQHGITMAPTVTLDMTRWQKPGSSGFSPRSNKCYQCCCQSLICLCACTCKSLAMMLSGKSAKILLALCLQLVTNYTCRLRNELVNWLRTSRNKSCELLRCNLFSQTAVAFLDANMSSME